MDELKIHIDWQNEPMDIEVLSGILLDLNRINKFYSLQINKKEKPKNLRIKEATGGSLFLTLFSYSAIQTAPEIFRLFKDIYDYNSRKSNSKPDLSGDIIDILKKFTLHFITNGITFGIGTDVNSPIEYSSDIINTAKEFLDSEKSRRSSTSNFNNYVDIKYTSNQYKAFINGKWIVAHFDKNCSKQKLMKINKPYSIHAHYTINYFDNEPTYVQINMIY